MTVYKGIYSFQVLEALVNGADVKLTDRETLECFKASALTMEEFAEILRDVKENPTRYDFWVEEEQKIEADGHCGV